MNRIQESHPRSAWLLMASGFFERLGHYGFRAFIVSYLLSETINMERSEALEMYAHYTGAYILAGLVGGVLGDFILGNRTTSIVGAVSIVLGMIVFLIPNIAGIYAGFMLVFIGEGLYTPNVHALFAKEYLSRKKLMVGGFMGLLFFVNVGAFLAPMLIGGVGKEVSYQSGIILAGGVTLLSLLCLFLAKLEKPNMELTSISWKKSRAILITSIAMLSFIGIGTYMLNTFDPTLEHRRPLWEALNDAGMNINLIEEVLSFVFLGIGFLLWTYYYSSLFHKMMLGFALTSLAFLFYLLDGFLASEGLEVLYFSGVLLIAFADMFIAPLLFSVIGSFAKPQYFASLMGLCKAVALVFLPFAWLLDLLPDSAATGMGIVVLVLLAFSVVSWRLKGREDLK